MILRNSIPARERASTFILRIATRWPLNPMFLKEKIEQDFKEALKSKEEGKIRALRLLKAAITNKEKSRPVSDGPLDDLEVQQVLSAEAKKRREALEIYEKANRQDLAAKEKEELEILQKYLPSQLSDQELSKIVAEVIKETKAISVKDMGKVMAKVMVQVKGRAEGSKVSEMVKAKLS